MAYTVTTKTSYGQRVKNSFGGIGSGILIFVIGTVLLWWNEGRAVKTTKMLNEAQGVTEEMVDINTIDSSLEGKLVHATGMTATLDSLVDTDFGVGLTGIRLSRSVEYYQWVEHSTSTTKDKVGGGQETTTTYTYSKEWTSSPVQPSNFADPEYQGVKNTPKVIYENKSLIAENVTFGAYKLNGNQIASIGGTQPFNITLPEGRFKTDSLDANSYKVSAKNNTVYFGKNPDSPEVGDVRVTFTKVLPAQVSILAKVQGDSFGSFTAKNGKSFQSLEMGTKTADEMYASEHASNKTLLWVFRILGILLIVGGLKSIFGFISTLAKVLPFVANILGWGIGVICWVVGLAWSFIVISIAWLRYRPVLGILLLALAGGLIFFLYSRKKNKPVEAPAEPQSPAPKAPGDDQL